MEGRDPWSGAAVSVAYDGGTVVAVERIDPRPELCWLSAGLVDLQVNGFGGHDLNGDDVAPDEVSAVTAALARAGTTTYVPTVVTASEAAMTNALRVIVAARERDAATRHAVPFVHLEGPYVSDQDGPRGVHPAAWARPPDLDEFRRLQAAADGLIGMITLSPHHDGAADFAAALVADGVRVAVGHTHASGEQVRDVVDAGARFSTHLGNGAHAVLARHPNYIWAQLAEDRLMAGLIADGHHLPGEVLTVMVRAKREQVFLVSDSVALAGMPPGEYQTAVGGRVELSDDGRLSEAGTPYLAGAARSLADGVAGACRLAHLDLAEALELATTRPGAVVGGRGRLAPGAPADLVLFDHASGDETLQIRDVIVRGRPV